MRLFLFLVTVIFLASCSQDPIFTPPAPTEDTLSTGWRRVPIVTTEDILDIFFINNTTGFCVAGPFIFRSTDGGDSWQKVYQSEKPLREIAMGSANNALFISTNRILATQNGGNSFDSVTIQGDKVYDVCFVNATVAYAAGQKTWKTTNAGTSWTEISAFGSTIFTQKSLFFLNEQTGWITGDGFFKTTNGGITWEHHPNPASALGAYGTIHFPDASTGYVTDPAGAVHKTSDGGSSFSKVFQSYNGGYHDVHFVTPQKGYVTDDIYILKTTDSGQTWTKDVILKDDEIIEIHFADASHGWACGRKGTILKYAP